MEKFATVGDNMTSASTSRLSLKIPIGVKRRFTITRISDGWRKIGEIRASVSAITDCCFGCDRPSAHLVRPDDESSSARSESFWSALGSCHIGNSWVWLMFWNCCAVAEGLSNLSFFTTRHYSLENIFMILGYTDRQVTLSVVHTAPFPLPSPAFSTCDKSCLAASRRP